MKKFYSFLCAAVALVGFAACSTDATEEVAPADAEKVSFTAAIENTKTDLDDANKTTWVAGDVVVIAGYEFVCAEDAATFSCTTPGVSTLLNQKVEAVYSYNKNGQVDSEAGKAGAVLTATGTLTAEDATFNFAVQNAFLHFTATGAVTLKADKEIFSTGKEFAVEKAGEYYVAINPAEEVAFSYESNGVVMKSKTITFAKKTIYNLGELEEKTYTVYVTPQPKSSAAEWKKVYIYAWNDKDWNNKDWNGVEITNNTVEINGYTYYTYEFPAEVNGTNVNVISNDGTAQTSDINLGILDKDYYVVYSASENLVYTEAPAEGSIEEYVKPETKLVIYLNPKSSNWKQNNERYAAYFWDPIAATWVDMTDTNNDGLYECEVPDGAKKVIICRMNGTNKANNWDNKWDQTADLTVPTDEKIVYTVTSSADGKATGSWGTK